MIAELTEYQQGFRVGEICAKAKNQKGRWNDRVVIGIVPQLIREADIIGCKIQIEDFNPTSDTIMVWLFPKEDD